MKNLEFAPSVGQFEVPPDTIQFEVDEDKKDPDTRMDGNRLDLKISWRFRQTNI